jgi:hypothetical protein
MEAKPAIDVLPGALGFVEAEELAQLRGQLVEAMAADSDVKELATRYHLLAEAVVNQREGDNFAKAQIGLIVQMGLMRRDGGRNDDYLEDLQDAVTYADNMGFDDIVKVLHEAISSQAGTARRPEAP